MLWVDGGSFGSRDANKVGIEGGNVFVLVAALVTEHIRVPDVAVAVTVSIWVIESVWVKPCGRYLGQDIIRVGKKLLQLGWTRHATCEQAARSNDGDGFGR